MNRTHEVFNQPQPLVDYNLFASNRALHDALKFNAPQLDTAALAALGTTLGSADMQAHARLANVNAPVLHTHDRFGRRVDQVEFHPSYHALMTAAIGAGLHSSQSGNVAPTLVASRTALPPEGAGLAWGGPARRPVAPTLVASRAFGGALPHSSRKGAGLAWGGPARRRVGHTLCALQP